jgi:hypothetical protein
VFRRSVLTGRPPVSMSHPGLRASTPIAYNRHIPCPTQSAPPVGLWGGAQQPVCMRSLSERSSKFISEVAQNRDASPPRPRGALWPPHTPIFRILAALTAQGIQRPSRVWVRRVDELSRATGAHLTVAASGRQQHQPTRHVPSHGVRRSRLSHLSTRRRPGRCGACGFAGLSEDGRPHFLPPALSGNKSSEGGVMVHASG